MSGTRRLTMAQALVEFLASQHSERDGNTQRLFAGCFGIFGHGNVAGVGQALRQSADRLPYHMARNEQSMVHIASGYARQRNRLATFACTSSIGPGATNMVTGAATATVNRLPVLLLPGDIFASRVAPPVLQQQESAGGPDVSANDAFRPLARFFDRITRPEQLLTALPEAMRVLTDPAATGAVVIALPQDVQSHAFDYPADFFAERDWRIRRPVPDPEEVAEVVRLLARASRPLVIAGGGVVYAEASRELEAFASATGIPVAETFAGKGAVQNGDWWLLGGIGLEGTPATNALARQADLVLTVGSRLTDFATASQSLFEDPGVRFASINVDGHDAARLGATPVVGDARLALAALTGAAVAAGVASPEAWRAEVRARTGRWAAARAAALDPEAPFDRSGVEAGGDVVPDTDAELTQAQIIGLLQEHARPGDTIIAAAGGPPGDLQKVWDATGGRLCHLEFGFSCMGYEVPAAIGVRLADPDPTRRVLSLVGDGTFLMAPTELVTAAQEGLAVTVVIPENHGYQVIHRLQMLRSGREFGNEFRYRKDALDLGADATQSRLEGDYLRVDLVQVAAGLGARAVRARTAAEVRDALADTRDHPGPVVIVVPAIPHADLPGAGVWWDVAPAEVSEQPGVAELRAGYEQGLALQRWRG